MIQRLQTIYLLAISIISIILVYVDLPFFEETGKVAEQYEATTITVDYNSTDTLNEQVEENDSLKYFLRGISLLSLALIFLYKNRKLQMKLVISIIALTGMVFAIMYGRSYGMDYTTLDTERHLLSGALVPLSFIILSYLAYRGINNDEKLVKSLDRIR